MSGVIIGIVKNFATGILVNALKEAVLAIIGRIKWQTVLERYITRKTRKGLEKLAAMDSNRFGADFAQIVLDEMDSKGLPAAKRIK